MDLDEHLLRQVSNGDAWAYRSWEPDEVWVVLGRGNVPEKEVYTERCKADHIPVARRRGGGGAVVLSPGILVISLVKRVKQRYHFREYFHQINAYIVEALHGLVIEGLIQRGISDICLRERKILGSSMYRSKEILFYTASLMVSNSVPLMDRYLKHPSKEPDYRQGREHFDFVTTIVQEYPDMNVGRIQAQIDNVFHHRIPEIE